MAAHVRLLDKVPSDEATDEEPFDEDVVSISAAEPPCTTPIAVVGLSLLVAVLGVALWLMTTKTKPLVIAIYLILVLSTAVLGFFLQEYGLCVRWIVGVICVSMLAAFKTFVVMHGYRDSPLWAKICVYSTTGTIYALKLHPSFNSISRPSPLHPLHSGLHVRDLNDPRHVLQHCGNVATALSSLEGAKSSRRSGSKHGVMRLWQGLFLARFGLWRPKR